MNLPRKSQSAENPTIDLKKQFLWNTDDHLILYQGQLNEGRGLSLLMESMELLPDEYKLVIIGNGSIQHQNRSPIELSLSTLLPYENCPHIRQVLIWALIFLKISI